MRADQDREHLVGLAGEVPAETEIPQDGGDVVLDLDLAVGVGVEFLVEPLLDVALEGGGGEAVGLGGEADDTADGLPPRVRGGPARAAAARGGERAGGDAGFQRDALADGAGDAGEGEAGVGSVRGRGGRHRLRVGGRRRLRRGQGLFAEGAGQLHGDLGQFPQHREVARGALRLLRIGRDGVHRGSGRTAVMNRTGTQFRADVKVCVGAGCVGAAEEGGRQA